MKFETVLFAAAFLLLAIISLPRSGAISESDVANTNAQIENDQTEDNAIITAQSDVEPDDDTSDDDGRLENDLR